MSVQAQRALPYTHKGQLYRPLLTKRGALGPLFSTKVALQRTLCSVGASLSTGLASWRTMSEHWHVRQHYSEHSAHARALPPDTTGSAQIDGTNTSTSIETGGGGYLLDVLIAPARRGSPPGVMSLHLWPGHGRLPGRSRALKKYQLNGQAGAPPVVCKDPQPGGR